MSAAYCRSPGCDVLLARGLYCAPHLQLTPRGNFRCSIGICPNPVEQDAGVCAFHQAPNPYAQQQMQAMQLFTQIMPSSIWPYPLVAKATDKKGSTMKMPHHMIADAGGIVVEFIEGLEDAKRKCRQLAARNKTDYYLMVPSFRFSPKETPVDEVDLLAEAATKKG